MSGSPARKPSACLKQSGISIEKRAKAIDRLAAVILLASYLDAGRHGVKLLIALILRAGRLGCGDAGDSRIKAFKTETYVDIPHGTSGPRESRSELAQDGVIRYEWELVAGAPAQSLGEVASRGISLREASQRARRFQPHRARRHLFLRSSRCPRAATFSISRRRLKSRASCPPKIF